MPNFFHFLEDINLSKPPLGEAWLEIKWNPKTSHSQYPFALGVFREKVKGVFSTVVSLEQANIPADLVPHVVRYKFEKVSDDYPVIQLGPAIASVNFTSPYSWKEFKNTARYLRENLIQSFEQGIALEQLTLTYRNIIEFDYINKNLLDFLESSLNIRLSFPKYVPGNVGSVSWPREINNLYIYELKQPVGKGQIRLATGKKITDEQPILLLDLIVTSSGVLDEYWASTSTFTDWLENAHKVIHEWFFAFVQGNLYEDYL